MKYNFTPVRHRDPSISEHAFLFVLKYMKLKRILLYHLWFKRTEGIESLEELLKHFGVINEVNIGKDYSKKFGDLEDYFGKYKLSSDGDDSFDNLLPAHSENIEVSISIGDANVYSDISIVVQKEESNIFDSFLFDPVVMHRRLDLQSMIAKDIEFEI